MRCGRVRGATSALKAVTARARGCRRTKEIYREDSLYGRPTLGVSHKSSLQSPSHAFRTFCNDVRAPTASQIGARGEMRELESTAASRARGVPVLAAPLHNACPGASRNAAIPSLVLAQQMRAAQQGQHQRCTACTAQHRISGRARACGIASSMCIQTLCDLVE